MIVDAKPLVHCGTCTVVIGGDTTEYWLGTGGKWICRVCHPPGIEGIVVDTFSFVQKLAPVQITDPVRVNTVITFTPQQFDDARALAKSIRDRCRSDGPGSYQDVWFEHTRDHESISDLGFMSEYAACLFYNLDPKIALDRSLKGRDPGYDFLLNGKKIQVKSTDYPNGVLMLSSDMMKDDFEYLLLVARNPPHFRMAGFISKNEFRKKAKPDKRAKYTKGSISVPQSMLYPAEDLSAETLRNG
jgi:hypothetical protein